MLVEVARRTRVSLVKKSTDMLFAAFRAAVEDMASPSINILDVRCRTKECVDGGSPFLLKAFCFDRDASGRLTI
jgi:hypothetical protein